MSRPKLRIKAGDEVIVTCGKDKGRTGRVVQVMPVRHQVVVEGVRRVRRHQKPTGDQPGTIVEKEMPIDISNVALWNGEESRRIKVAITRDDDGNKIRVDRKTRAALD